jgi:Holliday junction resolvase RusA-like endonuclease
MCENKKIVLTVYGVPQALKRHRHKAIGKFVQTYDPSCEDKENFLWKAISENKPDAPMIGAIELNIIFYMPRPKSHYGSGKNETVLKKSAPKYHTKKPDLDNMIKFVKDALNGVYWKDDCQIYKLDDTQKVYTLMTPRIEIVIEEIN